MKRPGSTMSAIALVMLLVLLVGSQKYAQDFALFHMQGVFSDEKPLVVSLQSPGMEAAALAGETAEGAVEVFAAAGTETYETLKSNAQFGVEANSIAALYLLNWYGAVTSRALAPLTPTFTEAVRARDMVAPYAERMLLAAAGEAVTEGTNQNQGELRIDGAVQALRVYDFVLGQLTNTFDQVLNRVNDVLPNYLAEAEILVERGRVQFELLFGEQLRSVCCTKKSSQVGAVIEGYVESLKEMGNGALGREANEEPDPFLGNEWVAPTATVDFNTWKQ